jgi:hypothetical protein
VSTERDERARAILLECIREELTDQGYLGRGDLSEAGTCKVVANLVQDKIVRAFRIDFRPTWRDPNVIWLRYEGDEGGFLAMCPACLIDSPAMATGAEAVSWVREHPCPDGGAVNAEVYETH